MKTIKKQNGMAMIITLAFLVIVSFSFIISNNTTYSNIKSDFKNHKIKEIAAYQHAFLTSMHNKKWLSQGVYRNDFICSKFGCPEKTTNKVIVEDLQCPDEESCYSVSIETDYQGVEISKGRVFN